MRLGFSISVVQNVLTGIIQFFGPYFTDDAKTNQYFVNDAKTDAYITGE